MHRISSIKKIYKTQVSEKNTSSYYLNKDSVLIVDVKFNFTFVLDCRRNIPVSKSFSFNGSLEDLSKIERGMDATLILDIILAVINGLELHNNQE